MAEFDLDLFVIGGGSGGVRAARVAAGHGARVAIAEIQPVGWHVRDPRLCAEEADGVRERGQPNAPRSRAARAGPSRPRASIGGRSSRPKTKRSRVSKRSTSICCETKGARVIHGYARVVDDHTIEVNGDRITAANILIATGSAPRVPPGDDWITSNEAFHLPELPRRVAILGAGYIGIEFAHIFAGFGFEVTLVHARPAPARVRSGSRRRDRARARAPPASIVTGSGGARSPMFRTTSRWLRSGAAPSSTGFGLERDRRQARPRSVAIVVDEWSKSSVPSVYAIGDVTGRVALTPVAIREGQAVADTLFGGKPTSWSITRFQPRCSRSRQPRGRLHRAGRDARGPRHRRSFARGSGRCATRCRAATSTC